jgi:hypothetical protein
MQPCTASIWTWESTIYQIFKFGIHGARFLEHCVQHHFVCPIKRSGAKYDLLGIIEIETPGLVIHISK